MFDPETFDQYIKMEISLYRDGEKHQKIARVTKRPKDIHGNPTDKANDNAILDNIVYEVEYDDSHKEALAANLIAQYMVTQVDEEGQRHVFLMRYLICEPMVTKS